MYATVRRYEGITDPAEVGRRVSEGFVPLLREIEGFVAYYWVDAGNGLMVATSVRGSGRSGRLQPEGCRLDSRRRHGRPSPQSAADHRRRGRGQRIGLT